MMGRTTLTALALLLLPRLAAACPVCFGASDGPMLAGSNMGILALLVVTLAMLGAFAAFFRSLARRAAAHALTPPEPQARVAGRSAEGAVQ
jgi:hypothetical protein